MDAPAVRVKRRVVRAVTVYRYDIFALTAMALLIGLTLNPLLSSGQVVFSDLAFGFSSNRYLEEIFGVWNERWSTSTLLNIARLVYILPSWLLSMAFGGSGAVLLSSFIFLLIWMSALSMYLFTKRIVSVYYSKKFDFYKVVALVTGAIFYALNPWVIIRIQHIYLLCGYSLFPLVLMFFFNAFDPKFEAQLVRGFRPTRVLPYRRNVLDLFLLALVFTISAAAIHYFFYGIIFLLVLDALVLGKNAAAQWRINRRLVGNLVRNNLAKIGVFGVFFALLSSYWLFAYVASILTHAQASQHNINVVDTLSLFSRNSSLANVAFMISYWWPMFDLATLPVSFWVGGGLLLAFMAYAVVFESRRRAIVVFFTVLNAGFLIVATGVKLGFFASTFVVIVTKTPIIGAVFRDPNKIVGLMAVGWSVLLTIGVQSVLRRLDRAIFPALMKGLLLCGVLAAFAFYVKPFYDHYIDGFYAPVTVPAAYQDVQSALTDAGRFDSKVLYAPLADNMTQSDTGVATPIWNVNNDPTGVAKATGDLQVYSSSKNTIFQHEGNLPSITYSMNFLQYLLDNGRSTNLATLVRSFGVDQLAYHNDYAGQQGRQDFDEQMLALQQGLQATYRNDVFTVYGLDEPLSYLTALQAKIFSPYGLSRLESLATVPGFDLSKLGVIFTTLDTNAGTYLDSANPGDYFDVASYDDLLLSALPADDYLSVSDGIDTGNAFLNWSKTNVSSSDWLWYLRSQDLNNFPFQYDFGTGVGVTFATAKLDVPPYKLDQVQGRLVADFDSLLKMGKFFVADNPQIMSVDANPRTDTNDIPVIHGEIAQGDPKNIWQAAKSGILPAKANNPYRFNVVISGRGVSKMHIKVRFYDADMVELGKSYVVAPSENINYDSVNFTGDYVSPAGSVYMRMDLLSFQRPTQPEYWWIHDIKIWDYQDYAKPNVVSLSKSFTQPTRAHVYLRTLVSATGGTLAVGIGGGRQTVTTASASLNSLEWFDLGEHDFAAGKNTITLENTKGFNAPNVFAIVPDAQYPDLDFKMRSALADGKVFFTLEAESDLDYEGNLQSDRVVPKLSGGSAISSQSGTLSKTVDVVKTDSYSFSLKVNAVPEPGGTLTVTLRNTATGDAVVRTLSSSDFAKNPGDTTVVVDQDRTKDFSPYQRSLSGVMDHYQRVDLHDLPLTAGRYELTLRFDSRVPSVVGFADLHKFDPLEVAPTVTIPDEYADVTGRCDCEGISFPMMRNSQAGGVYRIEYDPTCSKDWYEYASQFVPAQVGQEFLFHIEARSELIVQRHMKVLWLDANRNIVGVTYINDVEEKYKDRWNAYEQVLQAPQGATQLQFHVLTRGNTKQLGFLEMRNYSIVPYADLIAVDNVMLYEGQDYSTFFTTAAPSARVSASRTDTMARSITVDNPTGADLLLEFLESPNPLWELHLGTTSQRGTMVINGVTTGFRTDQSGTGDVTVILRTLYYACFGLDALAIGLFVLVYRRYDRIEARLDRGRPGRGRRTKGAL